MRATIKPQRKARKLIQKGLVELRAVENKINYGIEYTLETKYGKLIVWTHEVQFLSECYVCSSHFEKLTKEDAKKLNANPYSFKWNWCYFVEDFASPEEFANRVLSDIKRIM